jgi:hypothetical protein
MNRNETAEWLADALGKSGECAEHIVYARGRLAALTPRVIRAAARDLGVEQYDGARIVCGACRARAARPARQRRCPPQCRSRYRKRTSGNAPRVAHRRTNE